MYNTGVAITNPWPKRLALLLAILFIALTITRIVNVPVTFDEAWTYVIFVSTTWKNILICNPLTANNHIFNSLLTKLVTAASGSNSLFFLRLPNLVAYAGYLLFSYLLLKKLLKNDWWVLAGFILLNCNPFFFQFWGLCRGYGIAICLMTAGLYYFILYTTGNKQRYLYAALLCMVFSTFSVFSMLNVYLALIAAVLVNTIFLRSGQKKNNTIKELLAIITCSVLLYILIVQPIIELKEKGEFYYGSTDGFITGTLFTLIRESLFSTDTNPLVPVIAYATITTTIIASIYWLLQLKKTPQSREAKTGMLLLLILILPAISTVLQHWLFGTMYLAERTALFFYPLFIIQLLVFLQHIGKEKKPAFIMLILLCLLSIFNFIKNTNITHTRTWYQQRYEELVLDRITKNKTRHSSIKLNWFFMSSFRYYSMAGYNITTYSKVGTEVEQQFALTPLADTAYDYYYIHADDVATLPANYIQDTSFFGGTYILFKKK